MGRITINGPKLLYACLTHKGVAFRMCYQDEILRFVCSIFAELLIKTICSHTITSVLVESTLKA